MRRGSSQQRDSGFGMNHTKELGPSKRVGLCPALVSLGDGGDPECEGSGCNIQESSFFHEGAEIICGVEVFDCFVEIMVGVMVAGYEMTDEGDERTQIEEVAASDERILGEGEFEYQSSAAGFENAMDFIEGCADVVGVSDSECHCHRIEAIGLERGIGGVGAYEGDAVGDFAAVCFSAAAGEHILGYIEADRPDYIWAAAE